jgi:hypothetical protein
MSISLYSAHADLLETLAWDLNLSRSLCVQLLLDLEQRKGRLRREVRLRLGRRQAELAATQKPERQHPAGLETPKPGAAHTNLTKTAIPQIGD